MVARIPQCDRGQLQLALENRLVARRAEDLCRHLQTCTFCQAELEHMAGSEARWNEIKTHLSSWPELESIDVDRSDSTKTTHRRPDSSDGSVDEEVIDTEPLLDFLTPTDVPDMLGRLGSYEVQEVIGRGGMGIVLKARDPALNRCVAIKVMAGHLASSAAARKRFAHEARAAAAVVHDHVIPIYAVDTTGQTPYLVMPYIGGRSLQDRLDATGVLEIKEVLRIALQTAQGLAAAHAQGLIHRDIKPANILLENGVERVRITDFGLARATDDASQTQSGFIAGTPQYMAPEQARGEPIEARADLFSLGSVMYAMCTGHPPFRADTTLAVLRRICDDEPRNVREINSEIPLWLANIIGKLLAKSPSDRFQSAHDVANHLEGWLAHLQQPTVFPAPESCWTDRNNAKPQHRTHWAIVAVSGLVVVVALVLVGVTLLQSARTRLVQPHSGGESSNPAWPKEVVPGKASPESGALRTLAVTEEVLSTELESVWRQTAEIGRKMPQRNIPVDSRLRQEVWDLSGQLGSLEHELGSDVAGDSVRKHENE